MKHHYYYMLQVNGVDHLVRKHMYQVLYNHLWYSNNQWNRLASFNSNQSIGLVMNIHIVYNHRYQ